MLKIQSEKYSKKMFEYIDFEKKRKKKKKDFVNPVIFLTFV